MYIKYELDYELIPRGLMSDGQMGKKIFSVKEAKEIISLKITSQSKFDFNLELNRQTRKRFTTKDFVFGVFSRLGCMPTYFDYEVVVVHYIDAEENERYDYLAFGNVYITNENNKTIQQARTGKLDAYDKRLAEKAIEDQFNAEYEREFGDEDLDDEEMEEISQRMAVNA